MKRIAFLAAGLLLVSTAATAGPNWQAISLSISPANSPKVVAALDKLMGSMKGELGGGNVSLMASMAGGDGSHVVISSFDTRAAREVWTRKLLASEAWTAYAKSTAGLVQGNGSTRMDFVKSWGDENDKDVVWEIFALNVSDPAAEIEALDALMSSETGKKFPGQVHLSAVAFAGAGSATHLVSVGFESEAEAESWEDMMIQTKDWKTYEKASGKVATPVASYLIRTMKTWGAPE